LSGAADVREAIAHDIRLGMGSDWSVYSGPPSNVVAPSIVLTTGSPYRSASAFRGQQSMALKATVLISRNTAASILDVFDGIIDDLWEAIVNGSAGAFVSQVNDVATSVDVAGIEYFAAILSIETNFSQEG